MIGPIGLTCESRPGLSLIPSLNLMRQNLNYFVSVAMITLFIITSTTNALSCAEHYHLNATPITESKRFLICQKIVLSNATMKVLTSEKYLTSLGI